MNESITGFGSNNMGNKPNNMGNNPNNMRNKPNNMGNKSNKLPEDIHKYDEKKKLKDYERKDREDILHSFTFGPLYRKDEWFIFKKKKENNKQKMIEELGKKLNHSPLFKEVLIHYINEAYKNNANTDNQTGGAKKKKGYMCRKGGKTHTHKTAKAKKDCKKKKKTTKKKSTKKKK